MVERRDFSAPAARPAAPGRAVLCLPARLGEAEHRHARHLWQILGHLAVKERKADRCSGKRINVWRLWAGGPIFYNSALPCAAVPPRHPWTPRAGDPRVHRRDWPDLPLFLLAFSAAWQRLALPPAGHGITEGLGQ